MRLFRLALAILLSTLCVYGVSTAEPAPLPIEEIYSAAEFDENSSPAFELSPDGERIAFTLRRRAATGSNSSGASRFAGNGTPMTALGVSLHLTDRTGAQAAPVCADELGGANAWRPSWSHDSTQLAFYSDAGGVPQLWMYDTGPGTCRKLAEVQVRARLWGGDEAQWAPDDRAVYVPLFPEGLEPPFAGTIADRLGEKDLSVNVSAEIYCGGAELGAMGADCIGAAPGKDAESGYSHFLWENSSHLAAIDVASGAARRLVDAAASPRPGIMRLSPSGRWLTYLSVYYRAEDKDGLRHDLAFVPSDGGAPQVLIEGLPVSPRDFYRASYRWSPVSDTLVYVSDEGLFAVRFDAAGPGAPRRLAPGAGKFGSRVLSFTPGGDAVVVSVRPDGAAQDVLVLVPVDGEPPQVFDPGEGIRVDEAIGPRHALLKMFRGGAYRLRATDTKTGEALVLELSPSAGTLRVAWRGAARIGSMVSGRSEEVFATYADVETPQDIFRFKPDLRTKTAVTSVNPGLAGIDPGKTFVFETAVPTFDGGRKRVRTMVRLPAGMKPGDRPPAIVFVYPNADYSSEAMGFGLTGNPLPAAAFTTRGYAVIYPSVETGPGGEPGNALQEITEGLLPQVYRAAELGYVDIDRLAITGSSFGGYSTAGVITRTNLFRAAIALNGVYDLGGNFGNLGNRGGDAMQVQWTENSQPRIGLDAWSNIGRLIENSPYYQAGKIRTPLLLLQGRDDIFLSEAQKLFVVLRRLGTPVQLAIYEASGHVLTDWPRAQAIDGTNRAIAFLDRHLR